MGQLFYQPQSILSSEQLLSQDDYDALLFKKTDTTYYIKQQTPAVLSIQQPYVEAVYRGNSLLWEADYRIKGGYLKTADINAANGVCWSQELQLFVAAASGNIFRSVDGFSWTATNLVNTWKSICWSPERNLFVAVSTSGTGNRVATSPDGVTWTHGISAQDNTWNKVIWAAGLGLFVAIAQSGTSRIMTSPDGMTWTAGATIPAGSNWQTLCWSPTLSLLVAGASTGTARIATSPDAVNWTTRSVGADSAWSSICWSPKLGVFLAVTSTTPSANATRQPVLISANGTTWTRYSTNVGDTAWRAVCWSEELSMFLAAGVGSSIGDYSAGIMRSSDGIQWKKTSLYPGRALHALNDLCWSPSLSRFVFAWSDHVTASL